MFAGHIKVLGGPDVARLVVLVSASLILNANQCVPKFLELLSNVHQWRNFFLRSMNLLKSAGIQNSWVHISPNK